MHKKISNHNVSSNASCKHPRIDSWVLFDVRGAIIFLHALCDCDILFGVSDVLTSDSSYM